MTSVGNLKKALCGFLSGAFRRAGLAPNFFNRLESSFKTHLRAPVNIAGSFQQPLDEAHQESAREDISELRARSRSGL